MYFEISKGTDKFVWPRYGEFKIRVCAAKTQFRWLTFFAVQVKISLQSQL